MPGGGGPMPAGPRPAGASNPVTLSRFSAVAREARMAESAFALPAMTPEMRNRALRGSLGCLRDERVKKVALPDPGRGCKCPVR